MHLSGNPRGLGTPLHHVFIQESQRIGNTSSTQCICLGILEHWEHQEHTNALVWEFWRTGNTRNTQRICLGILGTPGTHNEFVWESYRIGNIRSTECICLGILKDWEDQEYTMYLSGNPRGLGTPGVHNVLSGNPRGLRRPGVHKCTCLGILEDWEHQKYTMYLSGNPRRLRRPGVHSVFVWESQRIENTRRTQCICLGILHQQYTMPLSRNPIRSTQSRPLGGGEVSQLIMIPHPITHSMRITGLQEK